MRAAVAHMNQRLELYGRQISYEVKFADCPFPEDLDTCLADAREAAQKQRRDTVGRAFGERPGGGGAVDAGHGDARVGDDDDVAAQPFVQDRFAAVELFAVVPAGIQQRRPAQLSQAS